MDTIINKLKEMYPDEFCAVSCHVYKFDRNNIQAEFILNIPDTKLMTFKTMDSLEAYVNSLYASQENSQDNGADKFFTGAGKVAFT